MYYLYSLTVSLFSLASVVLLPQPSAHAKTVEPQASAPYTSAHNDPDRSGSITTPGRSIPVTMEAQCLLVRTKSYLPPACHTA